MIQLKILPLSLYHELHIPFLLYEIINGQLNQQWKTSILNRKKDKKDIRASRKMEEQNSDFKNLNRIFYNALAHCNGHLKYDNIDCKYIKDTITSLNWRVFNE